MVAQDIPPSDRHSGLSAARQGAPASAALTRGLAGAGAYGPFPLPFRQSLRRQRAHLDCGGLALLREINALLDSMPPYSPAREDLSVALLGSSEILRPDSEGRITL